MTNEPATGGSAASFMPLRISAVAAVGMLGDASDKAMLEKLSTGNEVRLHVAAKAALKSLAGTAKSSGKDNALKATPR